MKIIVNATIELHQLNEEKEKTQSKCKVISSHGEVLTHKANMVMASVHKRPE